MPASDDSSARNRPDSTGQMPDTPAQQQRRSWWRLWLTLIIIAGADQLTKSWVAAKIPAGGWSLQEPGSVVTVIPDFFYLIHVFNTGAAWSMFSGYSAALGVIGLLAIVLILVFHRAFQLQRHGLQWVFGLICGGILGNVIDRFRFGHVVDFIDLHFGSYRYPTFNIADSAICVGVFLYIIWTFLPASRRPCP